MFVRQMATAIYGVYEFLLLFKNFFFTEQLCQIRKQMKIARTRPSLAADEAAIQSQTRKFWQSQQLECGQKVKLVHVTTSNQSLLVYTFRKIKQERTQQNYFTETTSSILFSVCRTKKNSEKYKLKYHFVILNKYYFNKCVCHFN